MQSWLSAEAATGPVLGRDPGPVGVVMKAGSQVCLVGAMGGDWASCDGDACGFRLGPELEGGPNVREAIDQVLVPGAGCGCCLLPGLCCRNWPEFCVTCSPAVVHLNPQPRPR